MSAAKSQFDAETIKGIVREVLRRLDTAGATSSGAVAEPDDHIFECPEKVIALNTLRGKLENVKTLRLKPRAIVTPSVRDELNDRKIKVVFDLGSELTTDCRTTIHLGTTCKSTGVRLRDRLVADGCEVQLHTNAGVHQLAKTISGQVSSTSQAMIVTDQPHTAACAVNRNSNVRAVVVRDQREMEAAKVEFNPNCVVLSSGVIDQVDLSSILLQLTQ